MYLSSKEEKKSHFAKRRNEFYVKNKTLKADVPKNALIELTNACNHACVFCFNPKMSRAISHIDFSTYKSFIESCVKEGVNEVGLYSTGDPFMTKNLKDFIAVAKDKGIKRVYITTNGALANFNKAKECIDAGLDSIKFSINAGTRESYKIIHGYDDFDKVVKNLDDIFNYKKKNKIKLQLVSSFVYTNLTFKEIDQFKIFFSKYFEEMVFFPAGNQGGRNIEVSKKITDKVNNVKESKESFEYKPCEMLWNRLHLTAEGYLSACCVDYENDLVYKKFDNNNLKDQFNSEKITNLRKKHLNNDLEGTICKDCIYNTSNNYNKLDNFLYNKKKPNIKKKINLESRIKKI